MNLARKGENVMDEIDKVRLMAELHRDHCSLNHGPGTADDKVPAADYLVIPFGYEEKEGVEVAERELIIPVCFECALALKGAEWTLLYCFECTNNHWVYRSMAKSNYRHHILWLRGCPECSYEFGGLYFSDMPVYGAEADLALDVIREAA